MYVRPQGYRYPAEVRLPQNYSGNTFREPPEPEPEPETQEDSVETVEEVTSQATENEAQEAALLKSSGFKLRLGSLFGGKGGIGTEELLILALVLLLADTEGNDDLILFLILLFFIK